MLSSLPGRAAGRRANNQVSKADLQRLLSGQFMLPPRGRMERAVELERAWKRTWMPPTSARASLFQLHMPKYHDQLLKDLGEPHLRKGLNKVAEVFQPYSAADYKDLFA